MRAFRFRLWPGLRRPARLRSRALIGVLAVTLIALAAFDVVAVTAFRGYLLGQTDTQLKGVLAQYSVARLPGRPPSKLSIALQKADRKFGAGTGQLRIVGPLAILRGELGRYYVASAERHRPDVFIRGNTSLIPRLPADLAELARDKQPVTVTSTNGLTPVRLVAETFPRTGIIYATTSLTDLDDTVGQIALIMVLGSACAGLLAAAGTFFVMRRGLRPVEVMAAQADEITAGDLTSRVGEHDPRTEVGRLGTALNDMLARIHDFVAERAASEQATRRFFADASHELRTPLASLRANAELYQQGALRSPEQLDEVMRRITSEAQRLSGLVDGMLNLARLDQRPEQQRELVDLSALVTACAAGAAAGDLTRSWNTQICAGLAVVGDEELLRRAVGNLISNVIAHTPEGTMATITACSRDGVITVEVRDDGPGVDQDQLGRIFDRFHRAPTSSQRSGSGLGLAIVAAVAIAHDGTARAEPNEPSGLRVILTLPSAVMSSAVRSSAVRSGAGLPVAGGSAAPDPPPQRATARSQS